jgi:hypothetical protein
MEQSSSPTPDLAYYYPETYWVDALTSEWVKGLLLFFDGIATLVPTRFQNRAIEADPTLVQPLVELGLLRMIEPTDIIDSDSASLMIDRLLDYVKSTDDWGKLSEPYRMSENRLGFAANRRMSLVVIEELKKRHLIRPTADAGEYFVTRKICDVILCLWAQVLRSPARDRFGIELHPITAEYSYVTKLLGTLNESSTHLPGHVLASDLEILALNLESVPIDEVLAFRDQYGQEYRAYRRGLNRFVLLASLMTDAGQSTLLRDRAEELRDMRSDCNKISRSAFGGKSRPFALGLAGAALASLAGDPIGAGASALEAATALVDGQSYPAGDFTYIFRAYREWSNR